MQHHWITRFLTKFFASDWTKVDQRKTKPTENSTQCRCVCVCVLKTGSGFPELILPLGCFIHVQYSLPILQTKNWIPGPMKSSSLSMPCYSFFSIVLLFFFFFFTHQLFHKSPYRKAVVTHLFRRRAHAVAVALRPPWWVWRPGLGGRPQLLVVTTWALLGGSLSPPKKIMVIWVILGGDFWLVGVSLPYSLS